MGDIRSIFGGVKPTGATAPAAPATPIECAAPKPMPAELADLGSLALEATRAADVATQARWAYQRKLDELMVEVNAQVDDLRAEAEQANTVRKQLSDQLLEEMTKRAVDAIPLPDRPPLRIKVTAGSRKSVTKKLLEQVLDKSSALKVWNAVERNPDVREVVIPPPNDPT